MLDIQMLFDPKYMDEKKHDVIFTLMRKYSEINDLLLGKNITKSFAIY